MNVAVLEREFAGSSGSQAGQVTQSHIYGTEQMEFHKLPLDGSFIHSKNCFSKIQIECEAQ